MIYHLASRESVLNKVRNGYIIGLKPSHSLNLKIKSLKPACDLCEAFL